MWPWNKQSSETDHTETLMALELAQLELDDTSDEVDNARDAYAAALATMRDAAGKRARIGRELSRTKEGARDLAELVAVSPLGPIHAPAHAPSLERRRMTKRGGAELLMSTERRGSNGPQTDHEAY